MGASSKSLLAAFFVKLDILLFFAKLNNINEFCEDE